MKPLLILLALFPLLASASSSHHHHSESTVNNTYNNVIQDPSGVALGIATSSLICNTGTRKNQLSIGVGSYGDAEAVAIGSCKRLGKDTTLNLSVGAESGNVGLGASLHIEF